MLKAIAVIAMSAFAFVVSPAEARGRAGGSIPALSSACVQKGGLLPCDTSYLPDARMAIRHPEKANKALVKRPERPIYKASRENQPAPTPRHVTGPNLGGFGVVRSASGATARVASSATGAFQCLVSALDAAGYPIRFMGGWRARGSVRGSLHPAGLALDVNQAARNVTTPRMPGNEIALANGCGLVSGAQWADGDSGHFQLGGYAGRARHYASRHGRHRHRWARAD